MGSSADSSTRIVLLTPLMGLTCDLAEVLSSLTRSSRSQVRIQPTHTDLTPAYDPGRDQYNSTRLLRLLLELLPPTADRIVGVVDVDLFVPVLTYVFGEAQLGGQAAVVSTYRLREPWLPDGVSGAVFRRRLVQTLLHELGHTLGLRHCRRRACVMTSAANLEMLDEKGEGFCLSCQAQVQGPWP